MPITLTKDGKLEERESEVYVQRKTCRGCDERLTHLILSLGEQYLARFPKEIDFNLPKAPLDLMRCDHCGLLQLGHTVKPDLLYRQFWYRTSMNQTMRDAMWDIVKHGLEWQDEGSWLDIGANDGYLLSKVPPSFSKLAVEPALNLADDLEKVADLVISNYFSPEVVGRKCEVITSAAMFYDLDDPGKFLDGIRETLTSNGVWINQLNDAPTMLKQTAFDAVCLPAEEKVVAERGLVPICEIVEGERVLTHKGRYLPVEKTMSRDFDGDLMVIRGYGFGANIRVTDNHPVLVRRDGKESWVRADQVVVGDQISRPVLSETKDVQRVPIKHGRGRGGYQYYEIVASDALFAIGGYYLAEGFVHKAGPSIAATFTFGLSEKERALAEYCATLIRQMGFKARVFRAATSTSVTTCGGLARWLKETFGTGAGEKKIPAWVTQLPVQKLRALYSAYMQGDGYLYRLRYQRANTVSVQLAHDLALVATRLGFVVSINRQQRAALAVIGGRSVTQRPLWDVLVREEVKRGIKCVNESGHQWGKVRSVRREKFKGRVYNISVAKDHTYVTPGGTVHNCHEHLCYYDVPSLAKLYAKHGLQIVDVRFNDVNGHSVRTVAKRGAGHTAPLLGTPEATLSAMEGFASRTVRWRKIMLDLMAGPLSREPVYCYGASTKGTVLLQYLGDTGNLLAVADKNVDKHGLHMVGSWLPIISEAELRRENPKYVVVLPWSFKREFDERESDLRAGGTTLVYPLPEISFVM